MRRILTGPSPKDLFLEKIAAGLKRKSLTDPARWACEVRIMGKPFPGRYSFKYHPWCKAMHESKAGVNVGQKGAQVGFTEALLNIVLFKIDVEGIDCLYILPSKTPDASEFSAARFDPAVELSPHLSKLFSDVKNVGHKRAGSTNLYIRGSKSRAGLKSVPVGFIGMDEVDEFDQDNIPLAMERVSGQPQHQVWMISTPKIQNIGISKYFEQSSQQEYFFKCPHCSRSSNLTFPESLVITAESIDDTLIQNSYLQCKECKHKLDHDAKPEWLHYNRCEWVPQYRNRDTTGFHISQLYSCTVTPYDLAKAYLLSLNDPTEEQIFYNDKMGMPHIVAKAKLTEYQISLAKSNYPNGSYSPATLNTMGVDVGKWLHYEVDSWSLPYPPPHTTDLNVRSKPRVLEEGKVQSFDELDDIMRRHRVNAAVIDAQPERRSANEFANRFHGHVKMCFYGNNIQGKKIHEANPFETNEPLITVDRTSWLDLSLGRFRDATPSIAIPGNVSEEYISHLQAPTRIYEKDKDGNPTGRYISAGEDHFAHARNYAEIALTFAVALGQSHTIKSPI